MPTNKNVIHAIPHYYCPDCGTLFDIQRDKWITKRSRAQQQRDTQENRYTDETRYQTVNESYTNYSRESPLRYEADDNEFAVLSCPNKTCSQYTVIKVIRIPRVAVTSTEVKLED